MLCDMLYGMQEMTYEAEDAANNDETTRDAKQRVEAIEEELGALGRRCCEGGRREGGREEAEVKGRAKRRKNNDF